MSGAIGFYGRPSRALPFVPEMRAPILALQGGADQGISHEDNLEFEGAPHSFFDRKQEEFQEASDDAWQRTVAFVEANSG